MQIPYKKDLLHSTIDYEKLIKLQAEASLTGTDEKVVGPYSKNKVKTKSKVRKRIQRGGK